MMQDRRQPDQVWAFWIKLRLKVNLKYIRRPVNSRASLTEWVSICNFGSMNTVTVSSYAKLNLGLKVTGRRPDGFHAIRSLFQEVDLADTLSFERLCDDVVEIRCDSPGVPADDRNLAVKAARLLKEEGSVNEGVRIEIRKEIPAGGGMGGGSSNAAATLVALNRLWCLGLNDRELHVKALALGSDVPFFLVGGAALVSGRGEHIESISGLRGVCFVAVDPGSAVNTTWAYANLEIG